MLLKSAAQGAGSRVAGWVETSPLPSNLYPAPAPTPASPAKQPSGEPIGQACANSARGPHVTATTAAPRQSPHTQHPRHCEERSDAAIPSRGAPLSLRGAQRRSNLEMRAQVPRLLRFARNDNMPHSRHPAPRHYPHPVIARSAATKQSRDAGHKCRDCFASLAMTVFLIQKTRPRAMSLPLPCHCEERSDAAIPSRGAHVPRLLRFARNDNIHGPHRQPPPRAMSLPPPCHCGERSDEAISKGWARWSRLLRFARNDSIPYPKDPAPRHVITPAMSLRGAQRRGNLVTRSTCAEIASLRSQ